MKASTQHYLKNHFLIAMPHMADSNFAQTLIYLIEHSEEGAMGLIVNRPSGLNLEDVLEQLRPDEPTPLGCHNVAIYAGGPVQTERGFVLHPTGSQFQATLELGEVSLTTSQDILFSIADGHGPERHLIALGYAGWGSGQIETELAENAWLTCEADPALLFDVSSEQRLKAAASQLGVNLSLLTNQSGHA
ncbi:putative transcriptional regulator [Pseudomonas duriflava]|uniref:UPF0301 protein IQ22_00108 n=1 Tax=Pseudomonas duriflava TaxID=459528 RepID=A0A562QNU5_9PSED|nr:YqgE/AlgH family protein [Pseudomonas duriflava]TWI58404.1 putative transcriptional regulator [Pseudomonas duriflava]